MLWRVRGEPPSRLLELPRAPDRVPATRLVPGDDDVDETLEEVPFLQRTCTPGQLELLVRLEVAAVAGELETPQVTTCYMVQPRWTVTGRVLRSAARMATILLAGVDLFFRGKLEALLPDHRLISTDGVDPPDIVICDIARIEPHEVADAYPDAPIIGYTNHTDTAGLRAAHAAGFDQVLAKSALVERAPEVVRELLG